MNNKKIPLEFKVAFIIRKIINKRLMWLIITYALFSVSMCHIEFKQAQTNYLNALTKQLEEPVKKEVIYTPPNLPLLTDLK